MSIAPIGLHEVPKVGRIRSRSLRQEARNYSEQLKIESQALKLCADNGFVEMAYDMASNAKSCPDLRARVAWGKIVADITRLGKRDKAETGAQQPSININILLDPDRATRILANLADDPIEMTPRMQRKLGLDQPHEQPSNTNDTSDV